MYWANFLHIYQPPTQTRRILEKVTAESYRRILAELKKAPQAKLTLNITSCLVDLWANNGFGDVIGDLKELLEQGQVELTASAKYHPLLPKLPESEVRRQILLDVKTNRRYFGAAYNPRGFFPPEAAYDRRLAKIVASLGFEWILVEELSYNGKFGAVKYDRVYEVEGIKVRGSVSEAGKEAGNWELEKSSLKPQASSPASGLKVFFRERETSFKILSGQLGTIKLFEDHLGERLEKRDEYLLTAMDGETFGHHRPGMEKLLFEIFRAPRIKTVTLSELAELFPKRETVETLPSTWALMEKDLERRAPFSRWDDPGNEIHRMQWQLTNLAIRSVENSKFKAQISKPQRKAKNFKLLTAVLRFALCALRLSGRYKLTSLDQEKWQAARNLLDRALHSDQYWWASARPWWSLEMIEAGAKELKGVVLAVPDTGEKERVAAKRLYYKIITTGFEWQRNGRVEEIARREDEEIRERTDRGLPKLPAEEVKKMVDNLRREMEDVARSEEYERAAQLRDRIRELKVYLK